MADRNLRERGRPIEQRFAATEKRVRSLSLRAYPGAVRTIGQVEPFSSTNPTAEETILSIMVPSGRWEVFANGTFTVPTPTGNEELHLIARAYNITSGDVLTDPIYDLPPSIFALSVPTPPTVLRVTLTVLGDVIAKDDIFRVGLSAKNVGGAAYTVTSPRLRLMPV